MHASRQKKIYIILNARGYEQFRHSILKLSNKFLKCRILLSTIHWMVTQVKYHLFQYNINFGSFLIIGGHSEGWGKRVPFPKTVSIFPPKPRWGGGCKDTASQKKYMKIYIGNFQYKIITEIYTNKSIASSRLVHFRS